MERPASLRRLAPVTRYHCKVDDNQPQIVRGLRAVGAAVQSIATLGKGCPDLLVGWGGKNYLLEVKDGSKAPSKRKLTRDELEWSTAWKGQYAVVKDLDEALVVIGALR